MGCFISISSRSCYSNIWFFRGDEIEREEDERDNMACCCGLLLYVTAVVAINQLSVVASAAVLYQL